MQIAKTPLLTGTIVVASREGKEKTDRDAYLQGIGSLMYLMLGTQPDIAFAVGLLARFSTDPLVHHKALMDHVYQYVNHTANYAIKYGGFRTAAEGWRDGDYATTDANC
jgi:hypothetical protein